MDILITPSIEIIIDIINKSPSYPRWALHESTFYGGDYLRSNESGVELLIFPNFNTCLEEWEYPENQDFLSILRIEGRLEKAQIEKILNQTGTVKSVIIHS